MTVGSALILHHQIVRPRVLDIGLINVQRGDVAVLLLILNNVIDTETACYGGNGDGESEQIWQMNGANLSKSSREKEKESSVEWKSLNP